MHRWFSLFGIKPHLAQTFKLSTDPFFIEKVRDIVGLYLNPPDHAMVLCVDEKSQIQALNRTQPTLPLGLGYVQGYTHDYIRHGTTTLFAALDIATGRVIAQCKKRHRHQDFLAFLRLIDREVPAALDIHLVVDNYAIHRHAKVKAWLAKTTPVPFALHPDLCVLAQPGGTLVRSDQPASDQAGFVPERDPLGADDQGVHGALQRGGGEAVRVGRDVPVDHRQGGVPSYAYLRDTTLGGCPRIDNFQKVLFLNY